MVDAHDVLRYARKSSSGSKQVCGMFAATISQSQTSRKFLSVKPVKRVENVSSVLGNSSRDNIPMDICSGRLPEGISSWIFVWEEFPSSYPAGYSVGESFHANIPPDIHSERISATISSQISAAEEFPRKYPAGYLFGKSSDARIPRDIVAGRVPERVKNRHRL